MTDEKPAVGQAIPRLEALAWVSSALAQDDIVVVAVAPVMVRAVARDLRQAQEHMGPWTAIIDGPGPMCVLVNYAEMILAAEADRMISLVLLLSREDAGLLCLAAGMAAPEPDMQWVLARTRDQAREEIPVLFGAALERFDPAALARLMGTED